MVTQGIPVDQKLAKELAKLARRTGRPAAAIASDALREYLEYTGRLLDDVDEGRRQIAAGRSYTSDEVKAHLATRRATPRKKPTRRLKRGADRG